MLVPALRKKLIRKPLGWLLRNLIPFTDRDMLDRYENFMNVTAKQNQKNILNKIRGYYPHDTRFVILPMDMEHMEAGKVKKNVVNQLLELTELYKEFSNIIIPFVPVDPRRSNLLDFVKKYVEMHNFKGIKIYPRLGFYPNDDRLYPIYDYAQKVNIPVLSHCSRGGVHTRKITQDMLNHPQRGRLKKLKAKHFSHYFTEPRNYESILSDFPDLRLCLAHFGGNAEWDKYLNTAWHPTKPDLKNKSWVSEIVDLMKVHQNLYTDISYTAFSSSRYFPLLSILLDDHTIRDRILFGSDYYMIERVKQTEREMSLKIRYALGEEKFQLISEKNTTMFLGE